jgi:hypothetical protein
MKSQTRSLVLGVLITGSLVTSSVPVMARDYWHWHEKDHRWEHRADLRTDERDLAQARRQLEYDRSHRASRRMIAQDEARIRDIERDLHADLRRQS